MLKLRNLEQWSDDEIKDQLGHPHTEVMRRTDDTELGPSAPRYVVEPTNFCQLESKYIDDHALLIDLGQSFELTNPPERTSRNSQNFREISRAVVVHMGSARLLLL